MRGPVPETGTACRIVAESALRPAHPGPAGVRGLSLPPRRGSGPVGAATVPSNDSRFGAWPPDPTDPYNVMPPSESVPSVSLVMSASGVSGSSESGPGTPSRPGILRRLVRPFRPSNPGTMPAGLVLFVMVVALRLAMVGDADSTLRKSDGKANDSQWRKDLASDVARVADGLELTAPRRAIDQAMGRSDDKGPTFDQLSAQLAAANGVPTTSPNADGLTNTTADLAALTPKLGTPTPDNPLKLWVGGDSVSQTFGTQLIRVAEGTGLFKGTLDFHLGTGLAVPSYFNWPEHFVKDIVPTNPDVIVISFGTNDGQDIQLDADKVLQRFSPEWYDEYQKRVGQTMDLLKSPTNDRFVIWSTPPPMGRPVPTLVADGGRSGARPTPTSRRPRRHPNLPSSGHPM
jgi:hypothetical protein